MIQDPRQDDENDALDAQALEIVKRELALCRW